MARRRIGVQCSYEKADCSEMIYQTVGPVLSVLVFHSLFRCRSLD